MLKTFRSVFFGTSRGDKELRERCVSLESLYRSQFLANLTLVKEASELKDRVWRLSVENERLNKILIMWAENGAAK